MGGTAIALYIGHRRSFDFDLFKFGPIKPKSIVSEISEFNYPYLVTRRVTEQMNLIINDVKFTFYQYPFKINATEKFKEITIVGLVGFFAPFIGTTLFAFFILQW